MSIKRRNYTKIGLILLKIIDDFRLRALVECHLTSLAMTDEFRIYCDEITRSSWVMTQVGDYAMTNFCNDGGCHNDEC